MGRSIPAYGLLGLTGFLAGLVFLMFAAKKRKQKIDDLIFVYLFACIFAMAGAKILYLLVSIDAVGGLLHDVRYSIWEKLNTLVSSGFVFYGGLFGAFFGAWLSCRFFRFEYGKYVNTLVPILPLVHGFGRIGCHLEGCCYGKETTGALYVLYDSSISAPCGVKLYPVQLIEAVFDFLLFIVLAAFLTAYIHTKHLTYIYLMTYATERFIIEFFRGDEIRGHIGPLSTSQWISCLILVYVSVRLLAEKKQRKLHESLQG